MTDTPDQPGDLLRQLAPRVLGALVRRHGQFEACEDAVQEAMLAAATTWPERGVPDDPSAWLVRVANRKLTDLWRSETARRRREATVAAQVPYHRLVAPGADAGLETGGDDTLTLLFLCCHPALTPASQAALTLRAVAGLSTAQIARAYLVPESTMGQRISRAKQSVKAAGARFDMPSDAERVRRVAAVAQVLYLIFNEGYAVTAGTDLHDPQLTAEAIRLTREVHRLLPEEREIAGLLALMLLTEARRAARTTAGGALVPLGEQDRGRWDRTLITEGVELLTRTLRGSSPGPYQLQAAIAAVHSEATGTDDTDWPQIVILYKVLEHVAPNPVVTLNRAVATGMAYGPQAGLALLDSLSGDNRIAGHHRMHAVRAHLWELAGEPELARREYRAAAAGTLSIPEQRYLRGRAARLTDRP